MMGVLVRKEKDTDKDIEKENPVKTRLTREELQVMTEEETKGL